MSDAIILLDTNVVSELMRPKPAQTVLDWFAAQDSTKLPFSAERPRVVPPAAIDIVIRPALR